MTYLQLDVSVAKFSLRVHQTVTQVSQAGMNLVLWTREEDSKEKGPYEIVEKCVSNFSQISLHKISEIQKLIYRESDEARSHQAAGGNMINMSTERGSICLFISVCLSINHLTFHSNLKITDHLMPAPWLLKIALTSVNQLLQLPPAWTPLI